MDIQGETTKKCLIEMFRVVGLDYTYEQILKYAEDNPYWYSSRTWTTEQEESFKKWMDNLLKKKFRYWRKKQRQLEIAMFTLMWGWKTKDEPDD
jgi:hypothetical protein